MTDNTRIQLSLTEGQAQAVLSALELHMRLGIGQIEHLAELIRFDILPQFRPNASEGERRKVGYATTEKVDEQLHLIKEMLGYPRNGSHGIGHPDNHISVSRSYEVLKVLQEAVAVAREPNPAMKTVDYDGLLVRYTSDPEPEAEPVVTVPVLGDTNT